MKAWIDRRTVLAGIAAWVFLAGGGIELPAQEQPPLEAPPAQSAPQETPARQTTPFEMQAGQAVPMMPAPTYQHPLTTAPFRDTEYGDVPHYGEPYAPSRGYPHYDWPNERYGQWYRPRAFGLKQDERCLPRPWKPRGYGNLYNRPTTCRRIDYDPYVLPDATTRFGPSYYLRQPDPRCGGDELISVGNDVRWYRFNVHHQLYRVHDSLRSVLTGH